MASCKHIITLALSKLGVASSVKPVRDEDLQLGLSTLISRYRSLIATGGLGKGRHRHVTSDYIARPFDRILKDSTTPITITLPELVSVHDRFRGDYSYDVCGDPRHPPRDGSFIVINDAQTGGTEEHIYEGYTNRWISVFDLSLNEYTENRNDAGQIVSITPESTAPLSFQDENGLAAFLAISLADHYGADLNAVTIRDAGNWQMALVTRFGDPDEYEHHHRFC
jgi:hypothetical protein